MAVEIADRRSGFERRRTYGPTHVTVQRTALVEEAMEQQVAWAELAEAGERIVRYAEFQQRRAWKRAQSYDGPPDAA